MSNIKLFIMKQKSIKTIGRLAFVGLFLGLLMVGNTIQAQVEKSTTPVETTMTPEMIEQAVAECDEAYNDYLMLLSSVENGTLELSDVEEELNAKIETILGLVEQLKSVKDRMTADQKEIFEAVESAAKDMEELK